MNRRIPKGALVVSCQARPDNPLHGPVHMAAMARAAAEGGAGALRANGAADIYAIHMVTTLPLIGLVKRTAQEPGVAITPDAAAVREAAEAGADIIALDATDRPRSDEPLATLIVLARQTLGRQVMADVATVEEGLAAERLGADYIATTLSGYTAQSPVSEKPDLALVAALAAQVSVPVVAEGRFHTPEQVAGAFAQGAYAVVVGTAITNPREITRRFAAACPAGRAG